MQFENAIYSVTQNRKNIMVSFAVHSEFSKINESYTLWVNRGKSK